MKLLSLVSFVAIATWLSLTCHVSAQSTEGQALVFRTVLEPSTDAKNFKIGSEFLFLAGAENDADRMRGTIAVEFWGLKAVAPEKVAKFLSGRPLQCILVEIREGVSFIDCLAAPSADVSRMKNGVLSEWMHLYTWLPELDLFTRECNSNQRKLQITYSAPPLTYLCDDILKPSYHSGVFDRDTSVSPW